LRLSPVNITIRSTPNFEGHESPLYYVFHEARQQSKYSQHSPVACTAPNGRCRTSITNIVNSAASGVNGHFRQHNLVHYFGSNAVSRYFFVILSHQMNLSLSAVKLPE
jgi:hypothetical protein